MPARLSQTTIFYVGNFLCPRDFICYEFCALLYIILLKSPNMVKNNPLTKIMMRRFILFLAIGQMCHLT
jgi:hypothetical protein